MDTLAVDADDLIAQRTEEGWNSWPADGKIGHLHLKTHDIGQARLLCGTNRFRTHF